MSNSYESKLDLNLLPDIDEYLDSIDNGVPVSILGLEDIVKTITAQTALTEEQSKVVLRLFFQEIRNSILRGDRVCLSKLGNFHVAGPATTGNKRKVFAKFTPSKKLLEKMK
jgi:nucleoid DNA-binding protein